MIWFYGTSTIVGYLMPTTFLYIQTVPLQAIQFSLSTEIYSVWQIYRTLAVVGHKHVSPYLVSLQNEDTPVNCDS